MVVFDSRSASAHPRSLTICAGAPGTAIPLDLRFEVREVGEIDMVSRARAMPDPVTHDGPRPALVAAHLARPATAAQRGHECGTGGKLPGALREPIG
jgi:hypothetical protein